MSTDRSRLAAVLAITASAYGLTACPGSLNDRAAFEVEGGDDDASTTCGDVPTTVFTPRCGLSGCHSAVMPQDNLDLVSPDVYTRLVGQMATGGPGVLIDPGGDPQKSVLYLKLTSMPPFGSQMPLTGAKLDPATLACVASWIMGDGDLDGSAPTMMDGETPDGGETDGTTEDSGMPVESGTVDSGRPDSSPPDASAKPDSGEPIEASTPPDSGHPPPEAGATDAGLD